ncbi:MAG: hypothetical protein MHM6MM_003911 [Cercozoa sp. M6MM]
MCRSPFFPGAEYNNDKEACEVLRNYCYNISNLSEVFTVDFVPRCQCYNDESTDSESQEASDTSASDSSAPAPQSTPRAMGMSLPAIGVEVPKLTLFRPSLCLSTPRFSEESNSATIELPACKCAAPKTSTPVHKSANSSSSRSSSSSNENKGEPSIDKVPQISLPSVALPFHRGNGRPRPKLVLCKKRPRTPVQERTQPLHAPWAKSPARKPRAVAAKSELKVVVPEQAELFDLTADDEHDEPAAKRCKHACVNCYKSKTRCSGEQPCRRCVRLGKEDSCVVRRHKKLGRPRKPRKDAADDEVHVGSVPTSVPAPMPSASLVPNNTTTNNNSQTVPIQPPMQWVWHQPQQVQLPMAPPNVAVASMPGAVQVPQFAGSTQFRCAPNALAHAPRSLALR